MQQHELACKNAKLIVLDNILAVVSKTELRTIGTAFFNGGFKTARAILNVQVPEGITDKILHQMPVARELIVNSAKKLGIEGDVVGMVTAVKAKNFHAVAKSGEGFAVSVVATGGCSHAESSGETIKLQQIEGTINIIVLIDGNPNDACLTSTLLTVTEAKTAAMRDLDIRSRYSGDSATGTITDAVVCAATNNGPEITLGGPASKLGQLIGSCTRIAVREAVMKHDGTLATRSILARLNERHLPLEKIAFELAKMRSWDKDEKTLIALLTKILTTNSISSAVLMSALKIDEDVEKGLIPEEFGQIEFLAAKYGDFFAKNDFPETRFQSKTETPDEIALVDLPHFTKRVLIGLVKQALLQP